MKYLTALILALLFVSCNPFISKDLRRKNKCNRKLERVIKKCPELLNTDTIIDTVLVNIPEVRIDSFIVIEKDSNEIDSLVNLIQDKEVRKVVKEYITNYIPFKDTIIQIIDGYKFSFYVDGKSIRYSVESPAKVIKTITEVIVPLIKPIQLTTTEKILNFLSRFWWWFIIGLLALIIGRTIKQYFL